MSQRNSDSDIALFPKNATEVREPSMFRVLLLNDDYTTMEFVVEILVKVFRKHYDEAARIMLHVHNEGSGLCGIYTFEVAESKVHTVHNLARENGFPLKFTKEKD